MKTMTTLSMKNVTTCICLAAVAIALVSMRYAIYMPGLMM